MCGIAGILSLDGRPRPDLPALFRMSQAMIRRGPDGEGYLLATHDSAPARALRGPRTPAGTEAFPFHPLGSVEMDGGAAASLLLAHRRLSIIDLSPAGHQPMTTDRRQWIVYNGEIYNFPEVRAELCSLGEQFFGHSDTEVLLRAYRRWGPEMLSRLTGMFALALWDDERKELFCARDRIGEKPFHYAIVGDRLLFASDIGALLASGLVPRAVDVAALYHGLSFGVAPRPATMIEGVRALEPAHWMTVRADGTIRRGRYWSLPRGTAQSGLRPDEAVAIVRERVSHSIRQRLIADVPVGSFLSGGIDSCMVTAMAAEAQSGLTALTLGFSADRRLNELDEARATAAMHPIRHLVKEIEFEPSHDIVLDMARCYEEPFYDLSPNYLISRFAAEAGVKVVLNGLGGDELFGGYVYYGWLDRWHALRRLRRLVNALRLIPPLRHLGERLGAVAASPTADQFACAVRMFMTEAEKTRLISDPSVAALDTLAHVAGLYTAGGGFSDAFEAMSAMDMLNYIGNHHVYRVDRFTMRFSIEGRLPLLDHHLVEAAMSIPTAFKLRDGERKWVLRRVAEPLIAPACLKMRKKGFDLPTDRWMRGPLRPLVEDSLSSLGRRDLFDAGEIARIKADWLGRRRSYRGVWQLVSTELWMRDMVDCAP